MMLISGKIIEKSIVMILITSKNIFMYFIIK